MGLAALRRRRPRAAARGGDRRVGDRLGAHARAGCILARLRRRRRCAGGRRRCSGRPAAASPWGRASTAARGTHPAAPSAPSGQSLDAHPDSYAELGGTTFATATAMGGLPYMTPLRISAGDRSAIAYKRDFGLGGGPVAGHPRVIDLWWRLAGALGLPYERGLWSGAVRVARAPATGTSALLSAGVGAGAQAGLAPAAEPGGCGLACHRRAHDLRRDGTAARRRGGRGAGRGPARGPRDDRRRQRDRRASLRVRRRPRPAPGPALTGL